MRETLIYFRQVRYAVPCLCLTLMAVGSALAAPAPCPDDLDAKLKTTQLNAWVLAQDAPAMLNPTGTANPTGWKVKFGLPVYLLDKRLNQEGGVVLVSDGQQCGWLPFDLVKDGFEPLKVANITEAKQPANRLYAKALIKLDRPSSPVGSSPANDLRVPLLASPGGAPTGNTIGAFGLYFIHKEAVRGGETYYFVGGLTWEDNKALLGWVRKNDIYLWDSRIAVYWGKNGDNVKIFRSEADYTKQDAPFGQRPDNWFEPTDSNVARFPLLTHYKRSKSVSSFRISFWGSEPGQFGDAAAIDTMQEINSIRALIEGFTAIDILFVIDGTESMTDYFTAVSDAVKAFAKKHAAHSPDGLQQQGGADAQGTGKAFRFAAAVYGDYENIDANPETVQYRMVNNFGQPNDPAPLGALSNLAQQKKSENAPVYRDALQDKPEAPYAGMIRAIRDARWSDGVKARLVIWIGDHGNHEKDDPKAPNERVGIAEVASALKRAGAAIIPINVRGEYDKTHNDRFLAQARLLTDAAARGGLAVAGPYDIEADYKDANRTSQRLLAKLDEVFSASENTRTFLLAKARGERPIIKRMDGDITQVRLMEGWLRQFGMDDTRPAIRQAVTDGWMQYHKGSDQLTFWISVNETELSSLHFTTEQLCIARGRTDIARLLQETFAQLARTMSGDPYTPGESISQYLGKMMLIPMEYFPTFLDRSLSEMETWWLSPQTKEWEKKQFSDSVCRSEALLSYVQSGFRVEPENLAAEVNANSMRPRWKPKDANLLHPFKWQWGPGNGVLYYYIPVTYLPQG